MTKKKLTEEVVEEEVVEEEVVKKSEPTDESAILKRMQEKNF